MNCLAFPWSLLLQIYSASREEICINDCCNFAKPLRASAFQNFDLPLIILTLCVRVATDINMINVYFEKWPMLRTCEQCNGQDSHGNYLEIHRVHFARESVGPGRWHSRRSFRCGGVYRACAAWLGKKNRVSPPTAKKWAGQKPTDLFTKCFAKVYFMHYTYGKLLCITM